MALFKLSEVSEEERKKYLQSIGIDADKFQNAQETKIKNEQKSENLLPIEKKSNSDELPIWQRYTVNNNETTNEENKKAILPPPVQKNNSVFQDILGVVKNTISGASSGIKQIGNYVENANEHNSANYKGNRAKQYLTSKNVDELDKSTYKSQDEFKNNVLLKNKESKDNEDKIETNLVKKAIQDSIQEDTENIALEQEKMSNGVTKKLGELAPSIGQMGVGMVANAVNPALGAGYFFTSAGGSYSDEAKQRGMTDEQAFQFGTIMGGVESATELIGLESFKKAGIGLKSLITGGSKGVGKEVAKTSLKTVLKDYGIGIADNFIQEAIIDPIQEVVAAKIGGEDKADWDNMGQKMIQDGINGSLTAMITGGIGLGINSCTSVGEKLSTGKKVTQQEYKQAIQDAINGGVKIEDSIDDGVSQSIYKNAILSDLNTSNLSEANKNELQQYLKENKITEEQFNQISETLQQGQMSKEEQSNINSNEIKYQYEESDNEKINRLRQDIVNNNWSNSQETKNFANMLEKIITDKDIEIRLDSNLKDNEGNMVNGSYKDGVITINPNSDRSGEFLAIHELTHAIGTDEMRNMVQKYRESNTEFNSAVEKLLGTYEASELNDEALADISGQLFSNQEFINNIANTKPSVFRKIYNEIKYLWHQFRGYKNQNQFVNDLYYKWTEAYNSNNKLNDTTKYSKQESENNSGSFDLLKDDRGRVLTKGQQERYKNVSAELKDNNGNLKTLYHQTDAEFTTFDTTKRTHSKGDAQMPDGIFLKDTPKNIGIGNNSKQMEVYAKIENPLVVENRNELEQIIRNHSREYSDLLDNNINIDEYYNKKTEEIEEQISKIYEDKWNKKRNGENTQELDNKMEQLEKEADSLFEKWNSGINDNATASREIATEILKKLGYDGVVINKDAGSFGRSIKTYLAFNSNQIKNVDNINPTDNPDVRYSKENSTWREYLESHFKSAGTKTDMTKLPIDNRIIENRKQEIINKAQQIEKTNPDFQGLADEIKNNYLGKDFDYNTYKQMNEYLDGLNPVEQENNQIEQILPTNKVERIYENTPGEEVNYTEMERPNGKIRKHYRSIIESSNTTAEAKKIAKELMGVDTYVKTSNKYNTEIADRNIETNGPEKALTSLTTNVNDNKKITAVDIATGERLIEYFSKIGDKDRLQEAIQTTAMAGTEAGQAVQAMSLLNHQTPQGQVVWIQRSIDKVNKDLAKRNKNGAQFDFTPEMQQKILNSTKENLQDNINEVYEELGKQVPKSHIEQLNEWRYFSMLANPKTHIRNVVGNIVMGKVQDTKNKIAGGLESVFLRNSDERNHTIKRASKEVRQFAKNDIKNVESELGLNDNKYNPKSRLQNAQRTFKSNILENTLGKAFDFNSKLLEAEDGIGLKSAYSKALAEYITANKLDINNISDKDLQKARNYAIKQAQEATFHQECQIASMLNTLENKNKVTQVMVGGLIPFKKTPMNVAITGYQYSPLGLMTSLTKGSVDLRKGKITANQYIDNISKGLTGTGIALLGYALTEAGILKASGGDDDKEKFEEQQGKQSYSIQIGDNTYSLDWLAPAGIPLFIGSELYQIGKAKEENGEVKNQNQFISSLENIANAGMTAMNPMSEMSMVSGLVSTLKSYSQDPMQGLSNTLVNMGKSYVNQMFPTALGQVSKTLDDKERSTTSTESGILTKAVDSTKNQIMSKIPGLRQMLPVATDVWGNEKEQKGNYIDNAVLPWNKKEITTNSTDKALTELYDKTGESSVLPDSYINKTLTYDKQKYRLTDQEYAELKKEYGKTSYAIVSGLTKSSEFNNMSEEQQVKAVSEAYKYAKAKIKSTYANWNDIDTEDSTAYKKVQDIVKNGGDAKDYFLYVGQTLNAKKEKEKIQILKDSDIGSKKAIYESTIGNDDKTYSILDNTSNFNIKDYLDYKLQDFSSDKEDDGTINGKTVSGSAKNKFYDYMDDSNFTYDQKLLLTGMKYKVTNSERENIFDIINEFDLSSDEKLEIMSKMKGFKIYNDGRVSF